MTVVADPLRRYVVGGRPVLLHPACASGFRTDRAHGLIYGPYLVTDPVTGQQRYAMNAEEASILAKFCPYCGRS
jgi:hypothetical protein